MDRKTYLKKFSMVARWTLPKSEAEESIADYAEILSHCPAENDSVPPELLGTPAQAAKLLVEPRAYRRWLAAFGGMLVCLLLPEWWLTRASFFRSPIAPLAILLILGIAAALVWFSPRQSKEKTPLPKGLLPVLAGNLAVFAVACGVLLGLATESWLWLELPPMRYGAIARWALWLAGTAAAISGVFGLIKARISDRRWRALYLFGLTGLVECVLMLSLLCSMSLDASSPNWWSIPAVELAALGAVGLVGTGRALC